MFIKINGFVQVHLHAMRPLQEMAGASIASVGVAAAVQQVSSEVCGS